MKWIQTVSFQLKKCHILVQGLMKKMADRAFREPAIERHKICSSVFQNGHLK
jgi:hypothetical protein